MKRPRERQTRVVAPPITKRGRRSQLASRLLISAVAISATILHGRSLLASVGAHSTFIDQAPWLFAFAIQIVFPYLLPSIWRQSRAAGLACLLVAALGAAITVTASLAASLSTVEHVAQNFFVSAAIIVVQIVSISLFASSFDWDPPALVASQYPGTLIGLIRQVKEEPEEAPAGIGFDGETLTATQKSLAAATGMSVSSVNRQIKALRSAGLISADTSGGVTIIRLIDKNPTQIGGVEADLVK